MSRYIARPESTGEYCVYDVMRKCAVATGLTEDEAQEGAEMWEQNLRSAIENATA